MTILNKELFFFFHFLTVLSHNFFPLIYDFESDFCTLFCLGSGPIRDPGSETGSETLSLTVHRPEMPEVETENNIILQKGGARRANCVVTTLRTNGQKK